MNVVSHIIIRRALMRVLSNIAARIIRTWQPFDFNDAIGDGVSAFA
jgi:hypothetical protein